MRVSKIALMLFLLISGVADAGFFVQRGFFRRPVHYQPIYYYPVRPTVYYPRIYQPVRQAMYTYQRPVVQSVSYVMTASSGTFLAQLNALRARYGCCAVTEDAGMVACSAANNSHQLARGIGHFYMGYARRQNSAMGQVSEAHVLQSWMSSPGHQSALLDPSIRVIGLHRSGSAWTFSAR